MTSTRSSTRQKQIFFTFHYKKIKTDSESGDKVDQIGKRNSLKSFFGARPCCSLDHTALLFDVCIHGNSHRGVIVYGNSTVTNSRMINCLTKKNVCI